MLSEPSFIMRKIVMIHANQGQKISFSNDNLIVKDREGKIILQYTCHKIFIVYIIGGFSITTGLIERGRRFGISFVFLTGGYKFYESIPYKSRGNTMLVRRQYKTTMEKEIAQKIVENKILNQRKVMKYLRKYKEGVELIDKSLLKLKEPIRDLPTLLGIEGTATKVYFNRIFEDTGWKGRQPRVKADIINVILDIGYTVLFNYIDAIASMYGFDTYKGNLHQEFYNRKSLICDLVEPFRVIIDLKIRKMYNLRQISEDDFICQKGKYIVNFKSSTNYGAEFAKEINNHSICIFRYIRNYYKWFMTSEDIENMPMVEVVKNDIN
ncbi:type V CRISPR-associated endonuclease Cas1 [Peptostreptococcaceae bacterium OttesenSCG-928-C18]|nr:type V CRISPR-associated endonuclease Cas1 [Peptostreptococcaceae bacterium OttesenSCG-928-C18]